MHGHSIDWMWTKLGVWHPYALWIVVGWLASAAHARRLALHASVRGYKSLPIVNIQLVGSKLAQMVQRKFENSRPQAQWTDARSKHRSLCVSLLLVSPAESNEMPFGRSVGWAQGTMY